MEFELGSPVEFFALLSVYLPSSSISDSIFEEKSQIVDYSDVGIAKKKNDEKKNPVTFYSPYVDEVLHNGN